MILLPYLMHCQELLLRRLGKAPFDVESRVQMLSRDEPYVVLHIPSRLECGTAAPLRLEEFPLSSLSLKISNPQVLRQQNDQLLAGKAGTATVSILSERGSILCQESMDVYFVKRVTSITLNAANNGTFLQGDTFRINSVCLPQGSANLSSAVWTASPAGALRNHGDGRFTALMPGKCTVCLTIGKVSQTLGLNIMPLATDLQLPGEIRFKVNAPAQKVTAALLPHNTGCKEIRCRTIDGSVAQWNPNTKSIVPIAEGTTRLEATVIGPAGNVLFQKQCPVVILPEKDIVTPPTFLTLAICCAIIAALVIQSSVEAFIAIETCAVALFLCAFVISTVTCVKGHSGRSGPIQAIISLAGALLGAIFLFSIF